jgi:S1-C subfamily serine protease
MSWSKRALRSSRTTSPQTALVTTIHSTVTFDRGLSSPIHETIQVLPSGYELPGLRPPELTLLRKKQRQLELNATSFLATLHPNSHVQTALSATLIFAQHEAGTAVCIDPAGWLLTCSHCIAENPAEWAVMANRRKWLLSHTGLAVQVECRARDPKRDLALLKIIAIETPAPKDKEIGIPSFASVSLSAGPPVLREKIVCIGQPGRDDLEVSGNKRTKYNLVEVSEGQLRGMVPGADPHDNSQIGTLKHDTWT